VLLLLLLLLLLSRSTGVEEPSFRLSAREALEYWSSFSSAVVLASPPPPLVVFSNEDDRGETFLTGLCVTKGAEIFTGDTVSLNLDSALDAL
jgi:hypothetical protein